MSKFNFIKTSIEGVVVIEPTVFGDFSGRDPLVEFAKEKIRYHGLHFEAGKSA